MSEDTALDQQSQRIDYEPTSKRKAELEAAYRENTTQNKAPLEGIELKTYGELLWIFKQSQWSGDYFLSKEMQRPNLAGAYLRGVNLSGASLVEADLTGADLGKANLNGASLDAANLSGVSLAGANLSGANLGAANLRKADLQEANLSKAVLAEANLDGANLRGVQMDNQTLLRQVSLQGAILIEIKWNGVDLTPIDWQPITRIGDEDLTFATNRVDKVTMLQDAQRAYRSLEIHLREQGIDRIADRFALRRNYLDRPILRYQRRIGAYFSLAILDIVAAAGTSLLRLGIAYLLIIGSFTYTYIRLSSLDFRECLVLSITSFHGRGFFGLSSLGDMVSLLAAIEGILGLFIEALLISYFTSAVANRRGR